MERSELSSKNFETNPDYPKDLSPVDIELIKTQCELQQATSKEQLEGFAQAYLQAKNLVKDTDRFKTITAEEVENTILQLAALTENRNTKGYRKTPVTFANGDHGLKPELIERAMKNFSEVYAQGEIDSTEAYKEFERIHPFEDGNGRVGDLLWKMGVTRETGQWPEQLPPDVFNTKQE